jgi:hypothetical protein
MKRFWVSVWLIITVGITGSAVGREPPSDALVRAAIENLKAKGLLASTRTQYERNTDVAYLGDVLIAASALANYLMEVKPGPVSAPANVAARIKVLEDAFRTLPDSVKKAVSIETDGLVRVVTNRTDSLDYRTRSNSQAISALSRLIGELTKSGKVGSPGVVQETGTFHDETQEEPLFPKIAVGAGMVVLTAVAFVLMPR